MLVNGVVALILTVESISDIKSQSIALPRLVIYMVFSLLGNLIFRYQSFVSLVGGIVVGVMFLGFGLLTKEGVGYGDGAMFMCLGAVLGLYENLRLLMYSLLVASVVGGLYALVRRKGMKIQIPFIPCVLVTFLIIWLVEVIG